VRQLARDPKRSFLMVEWDMHYDDPQAGLRHVMEMNDMFRQVSAIAGKDTLIAFTADHSFQPSIGTHHRAATICKGLPADSANAKPN